MKKIQILGTGCPKCNKLYANAKEAAEKSGTECEFEKVTDMNRFADFGVMWTPALVIDGEVKASGKVPSADDIAKMLS
ncbi:MAG: TM0996/MTH895 family glutaredoxin-like protein [Opitutales bacterium]|nr:TM0996/MTH895 family glutaredoxin-like protein [Opitutales bacterium]